jgi:glycine/D-amino acid oxidase-like deaminating enzyme
LACWHFWIGKTQIATQKTYDVVVVGAGIAGIAAAYSLVSAGAGRVALLDNGSPLALTSDKSTECYRNFWPGPDGAMAEFMADSIALLQRHTLASRNQFQLHQRGYLFATARESELRSMQQQAETNAAFGGGELRHHEPGASEHGYVLSPDSGFSTDLDGADLITNRRLIKRHFPYLAADTAGVLHLRNCGVLSAQQLGMYLLEAARASGVEFIRGEFTESNIQAGQLSGVVISTDSGLQELTTDALVLATGPHLKDTAALAGTDLPVVVEKHVKISVADSLGVIPRQAPLIIWNDPTDLAWSDEEREVLAASPETRHLTETFPAGVHGRPVGAGDQVYLYWTYDCPISERPEFPIEADDYYPEILLRGMARMVPGLTAYLDPMPRPYVDGGYYTKMADNRPLIGPLEVPGTFVCGAFSGYGIMAACAAGELLASHVLERALPAYASAFSVERCKDPLYSEHVASLANTAQI